MSGIKEILELVYNILIFIKDYGIIPIIIILLILFILHILKNPELIDKWSFYYYKYLAKKDEKLYRLLALFDALRSGRAREKAVAKELMEREINQYAEN